MLYKIEIKNERNNKTIELAIHCDSPTQLTNTIVLAYIEKLFFLDRIKTPAPFSLAELIGNIPALEGLYSYIKIFEKESGLQILLEKEGVIFAEPEPTRITWSRWLSKKWLNIQYWWAAKKIGGKI